MTIDRLGEPGNGEEKNSRWSTESRMKPCTAHIFIASNPHQLTRIINQKRTFQALFPTFIPSPFPPPPSPNKKVLGIRERKERKMKKKMKS